MTDEAFEAECEQEGWAVFMAGDHLEVQLDDERVGTIEDGPETDSDALELAKLFLARKVKTIFRRGGMGSRPERLALESLATAILNTEEGM